MLIRYTLDCQYRRMSSIEESNEVIDGVRIKNEPIFDSLSIPESNKVQTMKVKVEPIEIETQQLKSHNEYKSEAVEVKGEEKFLATEEFVNKASIAFLNEETTSNDDNNTINTNQATTSKSQTNKQKSK